MLKGALLHAPFRCHDEHRSLGQMAILLDQNLSTSGSQGNRDYLISRHLHLILDEQQTFNLDRELKGQRNSFPVKQSAARFPYRWFRRVPRPGSDRKVYIHITKPVEGRIGGIFPRLWR